MKAKTPFFLLIFFLCLLVASGAWLYARQNLFRLAEIKVETKQAHVKTNVLKQLVSYLGQDLLRLSLSEISQKVSSVPYIEKLSLRKKWPSTLIIKIKEREALFCAKKKKSYWLVDREGNYLEKAQCHQLPRLNQKIADKAIIKKISQWLHQTKSQQLSLGSKQLLIQTLSWDNVHGLTVTFRDYEFTFALGKENLEKAWLKSIHTISWLEREKLLQSRFIDATYRKGVLVRLAPKLQNSKN